MSKRDRSGNQTGIADEFSLERLARSWFALCEAWDSLLDQQRRDKGEPVPTHREPGLGLSAAGDVMIAVSAVRDACTLPALAALLGPLAALHWYGSPDEMEVQVKAVTDGARAIETLRGFRGWRKVPCSKDLLSFTDECESLLGALQLAEEYVERFGLQFDSESRQLRRVSGRGRPTRLYTAIVGSAFELVVPPSRRTTPDVKWNSKANRAAISQMLSAHFPHQWTDPTRHGRLDTALGSYLKDRDRYRLGDLIPRGLRNTIPIPQRIVDRLPSDLAEVLIELAGQIPP